MNRKHIAVLVLALSPLGAQADTVKGEIEQDLAEARQEGEPAN